MNIRSMLLALAFSFAGGTVATAQSAVPSPSAPGDGVITMALTGDAIITRALSPYV